MNLDAAFSFALSVVVWSINQNVDHRADMHSPAREHHVYSLPPVPDHVGDGRDAEPPRPVLDGVVVPRPSSSSSSSSPCGHRGGPILSRRRLQCRPRRRCPTVLPPIPPARDDHPPPSLPHRIDVNTAVRRASITVIGLYHRRRQRIASRRRRRRRRRQGGGRRCGHRRRPRTRSCPLHRRRRRRRGRGT